MSRTTLRATTGRAARRWAARVAATGAALATTVALIGTTAAPANADSPYERGPDPTAADLLDSGSFSVAETSVSSLGASGFGGGDIYYPRSTSEGTYGGVVLAPGYTASSTSYGAVAERIASHGFVVFAIDTVTRYDQPDSRGRQILNALDHLTEDAPYSVRTRLDESRLAVAGHSMGGGGTLYAASQRDDLEAAVALQPWHTDKTWGGVEVPTMIIGAENDTIASVRSHSIPFYESMSGAPEKAYGEINNAGHMIAATDDDWQGRLAVSWLKRYVDDDTRYEAYLCPAPSSYYLSDYRDTCPG